MHRWCQSTQDYQWPPLGSLTYSLAHSILPSCSNWHLVQRQADRGPLRPAPPEMWPSCQPSNPVQPPPEPGRNSRLFPLILTPRGTANNSALVNTTNSRPGGGHFASQNHSWPFSINQVQLCDAAPPESPAIVLWQTTGYWHCAGRYRIVYHTHRRSTRKYYEPFGDLFFFDI